MKYKMTNNDEEIAEEKYIIWCDNSIPLDLEIITKTKGTKRCWLTKAEYEEEIDKYKAIYKAY